MKAGIVLDDWKLPIFRKRLTEAGFKYSDGGAFNAMTTLLTIETDNMLELARVVKKCQIECAKSRS